MPNETHIECFFKSSELIKLCEKGKDIIINFKATYEPDKIPKFEIAANVFVRGRKKGKAVKGELLQDSDGTPSSGGTTGCPTPCK